MQSATGTAKGKEKDNKGKGFIKKPFIKGKGKAMEYFTKTDVIGFINDDRTLYHAYAEKRTRGIRFALYFTATLEGNTFEVDAWHGHHEVAYYATNQKMKNIEEALAVANEFIHDVLQKVA